MQIKRYENEYKNSRLILAGPGIDSFRRIPEMRSSMIVSPEMNQGAIGETTGGETR